jgi:hypothetical protein
MATEGVKEFVMVTLSFRLPDGEHIEKSWGIAEAEKLDPDFVNEALPWVSNPRKSWVSPQAPIKFTANVKPGCEHEVRAWLNNL